MPNVKAQVRRIPVRSAVHQTSTLGKLRVLVEQVTSPPTQAQVDAAVAQYIEDHPGAAFGISEEVKQALLQIAEKVAYIDEHGQDYYDDLYDALYPPIPATAITLSQSGISWAVTGQTQQLTATLTPSTSTDTVSWESSNTSVATVSDSGLVTGVALGNATITATAGSVSATCSVAIATATVTSIDAVYTQSGTVYDDDSLDILKPDLVVTALWSNGTTSTVASTDYTLSGTLTAGTSTVTVTYAGKTDTFSVTVTAPLYPFENGTQTFTTYPKTVTITEGHIVYAELINNNNKDLKANISSVSENTNTGNSDDNNKCSTAKLYTIPSGSLVRCEVTPTQISYPSALTSKSLNIALRNQSGTEVGKVLATTTYSSLTLNETIVYEFTAESDLDVWNTTIWLNNSGSTSAKLTFDVKIFVDGVRYV